MKRIVHIVNGTITGDDGYAQRVKRQLELFSSYGEFNIHIENFISWKNLMPLKLKKVIRDTMKYLSNKKTSINFNLGLPLVLFSNPEVYFKYCSNKIINKNKKIKIDILYAENLLCGYIAYHINKKKDIPYVIDYHGVSPEEFLKSGTSFGRVNYSFYKKMEKLTLENANHIVCVSDSFKKYICDNFNVNSENIVVIPSCINEEKIKFDDDLRKKKRDILKLQDKKVIVYAGGIGLWHCTDEIVYLFKKIIDYDKNYYLIFLTHNNNKQTVIDIMNKYKIKKVNYMVDSVDHNQIYSYYMASDIGIIIREDSLINRISSPTKIPEYLTSGLALLTTDTIGDVSTISTNKVVLNYNNIKSGTIDVINICNMLDELENREINFQKSRAYLEENFVWENMFTKYQAIFEIEEGKMNKEMRILQIVSNIKKNGPAFVALDLAVGLKKNNIDSVIASSGGILTEELKTEGIPHVYIPIGRESNNKITKYFKYISYFFISLQILIKSIKKYDIDVLHAHQPIPIIFGSILSFFFKIPLVITAHNVFSSDDTINKVYTRGNKIVAVSEEVRQNLLNNFSVEEEKVLTIHNGIDIKRVKIIESVKIREEFGIKDEEVLIGVIAGLRKQKALDVFMHAVKILTQKSSNIKILMVGDGNLRDELETLCKKLELSEVVIFIGFRNDVLNIMSELDIFCLSSDYEGLPISMLEAMVNNIPVVATAVGGIPELITSGYNGILVPSQDPLSLADELYKMIENLALQRQLAENAYNTILSEFNNIAMAKKYLKVYNEMLDSE